MKIIIINKGNLDEFPPTINAINLLVKNKISVTLICTNCHEKLKLDLEDKGVDIIETKHKVNLKGKLGKVQDWYLFKKNVWKHIDKENVDILWLATADTVLAIGKKIMNYNYYMSILELYDTRKMYIKGLKKYAKKAKKIIVPEYCRGQIFKVWWKLDKDPIVMPNKPFNLDEIQDTKELQKILQDNNIYSNENKKIILYQGHISSHRDITCIAKALKEINNDEFILLLLGQDYNDTVSYLKNIYSNIVHIPFIKAPYHLAITKQANIGIATYDDSSLNHIFCAPNKIYEYTKYDIPVLCRDIPGLRYTIGQFNAGVCIDTNDISAIKEGINLIMNDYEKYRQNARKFYDSVDMEDIIKEILI